MIMSVLSCDDLRRIFHNMDKNGDGLVSLEELNWLLERIGADSGSFKLESLVGKSTLDLNEFLFFCNSISGPKRDENREYEDADGDDGDDDLVEAFKVFDMNNDGFISSEELQCVLSRLGLWDEKSGLDCTTMICAFDGDSDGRVDFEEFKNMMCLNIN